ncbi:hypothetical protein MMC14_004371 [Varicellaria rhodocarpa]|nr:hypothetical protein [Varicellaria rhodocarpa]
MTQLTDLLISKQRNYKQRAKPTIPSTLPNPQDVKMLLKKTRAAILHKVIFIYREKQERRQKTTTLHDVIYSIPEKGKKIGAEAPTSPITKMPRPTPEIFVPPESDFG